MPEKGKNVLARILEWMIGFLPKPIELIQKLTGNLLGRK